MEIYYPRDSIHTNLNLKNQNIFTSVYYNLFRFMSATRATPSCHFLCTSYGYERLEMAMRACVCLCSIRRNVALMSYRTDYTEAESADHQSRDCSDRTLSKIPSKRFRDW